MNRIGILATASRTVRLEICFERIFCHYASIGCFWSTFKLPAHAVRDALSNWPPRRRAAGVEETAPGTTKHLFRYSHAMIAGSVRETYRHGNVRAEAVAAALRTVVEDGYEALSLRRVAESVGIAHRSLYNHFENREALLDAVAEEGFIRLAAQLKLAGTSDDYVRIYVLFALKNPRLYVLMKSRPHATMKLKPTLQKAVHLGIAEALRIFGRQGQSSAGRRREVMKVLILLHGGIDLHRAGILDVAGDSGLISELQAMVRAAQD